MIGKKIETLVETAGLKKMDVAHKLGITYQNLNRIFKKDSIETSYLFKFAEILNVPVMLFFEDEPGGISPAVDINELQNRIEILEAENKNLKTQLEDNQLLIKFFKSKARHFLFSDLTFKLFKSEGEGFEVELSDEDFQTLREEFNYPEKVKEFIFQNVKVKNMKK